MSNNITKSLVDTALEKVMWFEQLREGKSRVETALDQVAWVTTWTKESGRKSPGPSGLSNYTNETAEYKQIWTKRTEHHTNEIAG